MDALGDPTRRAIVDRLTAGPLSVGQIAAGLPISRPAVSQHLRVLRRAGLVRDRPLGTRRLYALDPAGIAAMREYWERTWSLVMDRFRAAAERETEEQEQDGQQD
jgi:DNA-binding transcriptional ArsR family regulator